MDILAQSKLVAVQKPDVWKCKEEEEEKFVCQPASISIYTYDDCFGKQSGEDKKLSAGCMNLVVAMRHQPLI